MSSRGGIQVARQRLQVGFSRAEQTVTIETGDTTLRIIDEHGELITRAAEPQWRGLSDPLLAKIVDIAV